MSEKIKYHYDEDAGVFVKESEISANWLVSEVLKKPKSQITKISNEEVQTFLTLVSELRMPDGRHCFIWLKEHLTGKRLMFDNKQGKANEDVAERFKYIIEQLDFRIAMNPKVMNIEKEEIVLKPNRTPNNMSIFFEPPQGA